MKITPVFRAPKILVCFLQDIITKKQADFIAIFTKVTQNDLAMPALVFLSFYEYLTSISSPVKIRILIERDRALMFRAPRTLTQMRWNDTIENQRIKFFNEWLKVLEGEMSRPEFDKSVAIKS